jgi:DNA mismatch endonuclease (patch repair protein)
VACHHDWQLLRARPDRAYDGAPTGRIRYALGFGRRSFPRASSTRIGSVSGTDPAMCIHAPAVLKLPPIQAIRNAAFPDVQASVRQRMSRIRKTNTKPELTVRRCAHQQGYRFRIHRRDLPGTPDLVFPAFRKVIFVNGCFWHQHSCQLGRKSPKTRTDYWLPKLAKNVQRDKQTHAALIQLGWSVLVIWECETRDSAQLAGRLAAFLGCRPDASRNSTNVAQQNISVTDWPETVSQATHALQPMTMSSPRT